MYLFMIGNRVNKFHFSSKLDPSRNVIALEHVPENTSIENMKRLRVNAQVTAITTILEVVGNLIFMMTWSFITKFAKYTTLLQGMTLYLVILPYAFLMNTSQNKARVVEEGWIPIFKNIFRFQVCQSETVDDDNIHNSYGRGKRNRARSEMPKSKEIADIHISTIFRSPNIHGIKDREQTTLTLNIPMVELPCSSDNSNKNPTSSFKNDECMSSEGGEISTFIDAEDARRELIKGLQHWEALDEHYYTVYFRQFVSFEDAVKKDDTSWRSCYNKKINLDALATKFYMEEKIELLHSDCLKERNNLMPDDVNNQHDLVKDVSNRSEQRKTMLNDLLLHSCKCDGTYEELMEKLIEMEENFIECD